jgi:hypothetical protein
MDPRPALPPLPHPHRLRPGPPPAVGPKRAAPESGAFEEIDAADLFLEAPKARPPRAPVVAARPPRPPAPPSIAAPEGKVPLAKLPLGKRPAPRAPTDRTPIVEVPLAPESIIEDAILEEADASIVDVPIGDESTAASVVAPPVVAPPVVSPPVVAAPIVVSPAATAAAAPRTSPRAAAPAPWVAPRGAAASGSRWGADEVAGRTPWWRYTAASAGLSALVTTAVLMIGLDRAAASSRPTPPPAEVVIAYDPASLADPSPPAPAPSVDADEAPRLLARRVALRGTRNLAAGLEGPARSAFEEALRLDPRNRAALAGLGRLDVAAKRFASAIERLSLAVRLEPRDRELHELLATAHGELGHERAAARHIRLAQAGAQAGVAGPEI